MVYSSKPVHIKKGYKIVDFHIYKVLGDWLELVKSLVLTGILSLKLLWEKSLILKKKWLENRFYVPGSMDEPL